MKRATSDAGPQIITVLGPFSADKVGVTDAHQHVWIERGPGVGPGAPVLTDAGTVSAGLTRYKGAGGSALVDCQPGGCGRNVGALSALAQRTGVTIVACTGFHLRKYYERDHWLWSAGESDARDYFVRELRDGVQESVAPGAANAVVRAGFIKIACTATPGEPPERMLAAAASACALTGAAMLVHTEQGALAEEILERLMRLGAPVGRIVLCHMDKRPDFGLHRALARRGALLEYDTFFRPKYDPERHVWPLVGQMLAEGLHDSIAIGTDLADAESWREPGPAGLLTAIAPRLVAMGCSADVVSAFIGKNIVARLAAEPQGERDR